MFGSKGKKALDRSMKGVLHAFAATVEESVGCRRDTDTTIMFIGWVHFAISAMLSSGAMKASEINGVLTNAAMAVRFFAPNHELGHGYIEEGQNRIFAVLQKTKGAMGWAFAYYDLAKDDLKIEEAAFAGSLEREGMAVRAG